MNLNEFIANRVKENGSKMIFQVKDGWSWKQITWLDFDKDVRSVAAFLLGLGLSPGDRVLIFYPNVKESLWSEMAIGLIGGVSVSISVNEPDGHVEQVVADLSPRFVFTPGGSNLARMKEIASRSSSIERVIAYTDAAVGEDKLVIPYAAMVKFGAMKLRSLVDEIDRISRSIHPSTKLGILTNSNGNGVTLKKKFTHKELVATVMSASDKLSHIGEENQVFSHLPEATPFTRLVNYVAINLGLRIAQAGSTDEFYDDLLEVSPTVLFKTSRGVGDLFRRFQNGYTLQPNGKNLKKALGGRVKYLVTDSELDHNHSKSFKSADVEIIVLDELNNCGL